MKNEILTKEEREYLSCVIKPFRDRVMNIVKYKSFCNNKEEYIAIYYYRNDMFIECVKLAIFEEGAMYNNMEINKTYTKEDLKL